MTNYRAFHVQPISGALGAEVSGIDLSGQLSASAADEIREALNEYVVLLFRDQNLSLADQRRFAARFGPLIPHPYVTGLDEDPDIFEIVREPGEGYSWDNFYHSDLMFLEKPPMASALFAVEVPPFGADTEFCNMYLAYETLSERMRQMLAPLRGVNESGDPSHWSSKYEGMHERRNSPAAATHPIVRVHPETGRKALYLSPAFTTRFEGMTDKESAPLIDFLYAHATQSQFGCRLHWKQGSLALWDNRVSLHHAVADYFGEVARHRRVMRRATIEGEVPIAA
ncbi:MAG: TauD/TfdA dioxygenase family protein [Gammaproteobacteria bacterium]